MRLTRGNLRKWAERELFDFKRVDIRKVLSIHLDSVGSTECTFDHRALVARKAFAAKRKQCLDRSISLRKRFILFAATVDKTFNLGSAGWPFNISRF